MSRNESHLRSFNFDTKFSSGDFNSMDHQPPQVFKEDGDCKQDGEYKEENNNEINELSKDLSEMGCIVEGVTRPPNICVETCVYDSDSESEENYSANENDEDNYYSDEFEEDRSEVEAKPVQYEGDNKEENMSPPQSTINLSKSHSFMSCSKPPVSISGKSSNVSTAASRTRRVNMSFSNERLREIERHNHILLNKILSARNSRKSSIPAAAAERRPVPAAAVLRKKQQQKIDHDNMILCARNNKSSSIPAAVEHAPLTTAAAKRNEQQQVIDRENMILLKKLQRAKSSSYSVRR